jgi:hypothetical protein
VIGGMKFENKISIISRQSLGNHPRGLCLLFKQLTADCHSAEGYIELENIPPSF